jgi:hypothetical protein
MCYLEGWYAITEANRIFGFDGWSRETLESRCVLARENRGNFLAIYLARVRVTVHADGATIIREGHGTGEGRGTSPGEVHDTALKAAETDATKRALATFGKPFGLELYRGGRTPQKPLPSPAIPVPADVRLGFHPDDTTPIPRPSHYYGRRQNSSNEHFRNERRQAEHMLMDFLAIDRANRVGLVLFRLSLGFSFRRLYRSRSQISPRPLFGLLRGDGSCPNLASILPEGRNTPILGPIRESSGESQSVRYPT